MPVQDPEKEPCGVSSGSPEDGSGQALAELRHGVSHGAQPGAETKGSVSALAVERLESRRGGLKGRVARGVAWSMAEKGASMLLQLGVSILLLRLLLPADFGVVAILTAFSAVALIMVDSGFSQTLIRKPKPSPEEYASVFRFNMVVSLVLYALLVALSPLAASFYQMPILVQTAPVFFLVLPVNALCVIQQAVLTRRFRFALQSKVTFAANFAAGAAAVGMALAGCGVWSIVAQRVMMMAVRAALLWGWSDWRPSGRFEAAALSRMAPYSFSLMTADLISTLYNKVPQFFFGRMYPAQVLGYFDQAVKLKDQPVNSAMQAVQSVTFPALSKVCGDRKRLAESYRQVVMVVAFALFPAMAGMIAVAQDLFTVLIGEKWMPTVPYFRVVCLAGFFYPIAIVAYNVLKVKSNGKIIVRLEVVKRIIMTGILVLTIIHGVMAVVWGLVGMSFLEMCLNVGAARRFTTLTIRRMLRTLLPVGLVTMAMYAVVRVTGWWIEDPLLRLLSEVALGVAVYGGLAALCRLEAFREIVGLLRRELCRN